MCSQHRAGILLVFVVCCAACTNDPARVKSYSQLINQPLQTAHDIDVLYSDSAKVKVHLTAPQVDDYAGSDPYTEFVKGLKVDFYNDSLKKDAWLTANYAIRHTRKNIMEAKNNVVLVNSEGTKLNTDELVWDANTHRIHSDSKVTITSANKVIWGTGMESDEMFEDWHIKNIEGQLDLNKMDSALNK